MILVSTAAASRAVTERSYAVNAGRTFQTLGNLELRNTRHAVTYADAIRVFGRPSMCQRFASGSAIARWTKIGIRIRIATLGAIPPGKTQCSAPRSVQIDSAFASGPLWHTPRGLHIGDAVDDLKALYPTAIYQRRRIGLWPAPAYWIVHVRERCLVGLCRSRYETVPRLTAHVQNGVVTEFFFPVGAEGD